MLIFGESIVIGEEEVYALDDPMDVDYDAGVLREFSTCLTAGNVDKKTHGLVILGHMLNIFQDHIILLINQHIDVYSLNVCHSLFLKQSSLQAVYGTGHKKSNL